MTLTNVDLNAGAQWEDVNKWSATELRNALQGGVVAIAVDAGSDYF